MNKISDFLWHQDSFYVWFKFPSVEALAEASVKELRELGFGYRADGIVTAARQLLHLSEAFHENVPSMSRDDCCRQFLLSLKDLSRVECVKQLEQLRYMLSVHIYMLVRFQRCRTQGCWLYCFTILRQNRMCSYWYAHTTNSKVICT